MAVGKKRKRLSAAERRAVILLAAEKLFAAEGYRNTSMSEIANGAGVSKPVLYDHFRSKHDLFTGVLHAIRGDLLAHGTSIVSGANSAETRIRTGIDAFFKFVEARPSAAKVMFILAREEPETAVAAAELQRQVTESLSKLLSLITQQREPWRALAMTEFVKSGLHALAEWWLSNPQISREDMVDTVMRTVWTGLASPPRD